METGFLAIMKVVSRIINYFIASMRWARLIVVVGTLLKYVFESGTC